MAGQDERLDALEGRIERIEQALTARPRREAVDVSAEELHAYLKVSDVLGPCLVGLCYCRLWLGCRACDVECACGPCGVGRFGGGLSDFMRFGG